MGSATVSELDIVLKVVIFEWVECGGDARRDAVWLLSGWKHGTSTLYTSSSKRVIAKNGTSSLLYFFPNRDEHQSDGTPHYPNLKQEMVLVVF
jgi:hypothetical protein